MATRHRKHSRKNNRFKRTLKHGFRAVKSTSKKGFNTVKTTSKKGFNTVKSTSKKYMPQVKTGLEKVGSKVTKTANKSVPVLQKASRDLFSMFEIKKKK
jgi:gas vesicle protein